MTQFSYPNVAQQLISKRLNDLQHDNNFKDQLNNKSGILLKTKEVQENNVNFHHSKRECDVIEEIFKDRCIGNTKNTSSKPLFRSFVSLLEYQGPLQDLYHEASLNLNPLVETHPAIFTSQQASNIMTSQQQEQLNACADGLVTDQNAKGSQPLSQKLFEKYSTINLEDIFPCGDNAIPPTYFVQRKVTSLLNGENDELMANLRQQQEDLNNRK